MVNIFAAGFFWLLTCFALGYICYGLQHNARYPGSAPKQIAGMVFMAAWWTGFAIAHFALWLKHV